jgi:hypothetical protein
MNNPQAFPSNAGDWHWKVHVGGYFAKAIRARGEQA